jgi:hypothetical protein
MSAHARIAASLALIAGLALAHGLVQSPTGEAMRTPQPAPRTAIVVLENHEYGEVIGNPGAPFINRLARRGSIATNHFAVTHPSMPNYLAILGGSTFGIEENCTDCRARGDNLAAQLSRAGLSWRAYMEDMPEPCYPGPTHGRYVKRHNPFMYFETIASVPRRCRNVVPATALDQDLRRDRLARFTWITPNLCHGAHDCGISVADLWLSKRVPRINRKLGPGGILVITFDEGTTDLGCCRGSAGGKIATIVAGPGARRGVELTRELDHYSLLATIEDRYGLPRLRMARGAPTLAGTIAGDRDGSGRR